MRAFTAHLADLRIAPVTSHPMFASVLCGADNTAAGYTARRQAELLASPGGSVEVVPAATLIRRAPERLRDRCRDHDLLVIADGPGAHRTLEYAPIPLLLARWCPGGPAALAESILVTVDDREEAVELAGRLSACYGSRVALLAAPRNDPALERALNACERIVLERTGAAPTILGRELPLERAIAARCENVGATLLVLGTGGAGIAPRTAADIAARVGCCVLAFPVPAPAPRMVASDERRRRFVPARTSREGVVRTAGR